jgi:hypothetical protein
MRGNLTNYERGASVSELRSSGPLSDRPRLDSASKHLWGKSAPEEKLQLVAHVSQKTASKESKTTNSNVAVLRGQVKIRVGTKISLAFDGMIDTGAIVSVIPRALVEAWKLKPTGTITLSGFDSPPQEYNRYWVEFVIPDLSPRLLCVPATDRIDVLIGRDILDKCRFTYNGAIKSYSLYEPTVVGRMISWLIHACHRLRDRLLGRG